MIDGVAIALVVLVGVMTPAVPLGASLVRFDGGRPVRAQDDPPWLRAWLPLLLVAAAAAVAVGLVELLVFRATLVAALRWEVALAAVVMCAWSDGKDHIIPNKLVICVMLMAVALCGAQILAEDRLWSAVVISALAGCALGGGVFFASRFVTRGGVGYGDVKLFAALGLLLGLQALFNVLFYALLAAFVYAIALLVSRKGKIHDRFPLGPFALIGVLVSIGFGV